MKFSTIFYENSNALPTPDFIGRSRSQVRTTSILPFPLIRCCANRLTPPINFARLSTDASKRRGFADLRPRFDSKIPFWQDAYPCCTVAGLNLDRRLAFSTERKHMDITAEVDAFKEKVHHRMLLETTERVKKEREYSHKYYKANREKILAKTREHYLKHRRSLRLRLRDIPQDRLDEIYRKWCGKT